MVKQKPRNYIFVLIFDIFYVNFLYRQHFWLSIVLNVIIEILSNRYDNSDAHMLQSADLTIFLQFVFYKLLLKRSKRI